MRGIEVKKSLISGTGVFATQDFKKGDVVIKWSDCSQEVSAFEYEQLSDREKKCVSRGTSGELILFGPSGSFMNHSCDSNTRAYKNCDVATRAIHVGEEITADYDHEQISFQFTCSCGSKNCRMKIGVKSKNV